jgi:DNA polymerase-1
MPTAAGPNSRKKKSSTDPVSGPNPALAAATPATAAGELVLVDAMGYVFRAYHALPRLSNSRGQPTHAVLGFTNMLRKLMTEMQPQYIAVVWEGAGPTFREREFAEYKANRAEMPADLAPQLPYIRRVAEAMRIPILEYPSFEADDVIGSIARQAAEAGHRVTIVSSDKDMLQLVNERVCVLIPTKDNLVCDEEKVRELLGVRPGQVADLLALRGDAVDNIPGAPGIGEKGARDLIQRFGSIEQALEHAAEVEKKTYRESLLNNRDVIVLSKRLATIDVTAPVGFDLEALARQEPDPEATRELYRELEFTNLLKSLPPATAKAAGEQPPLALESTLATAESLAALLALSAAGRPTAISPNAGCDLIGIAAGPLNEDSPASPQASADTVSGGGELNVTALHAGRELFPMLSEALQSPGRRWVAHDIKELRKRLRAAGLPAPAHDFDRLDDTQLFSYLLDPVQSSHAIEDVVQRRFGVALSGNPAETAAFTLRLGALLRPEIEKAGLMRPYRELDFPLIPVLERIEQAGVWVDRSELERMSATLEHQCIAEQERIFDLAGASFNVNSTKQLGEILFEKLGLPMPPRRGKSKAPSTAMDVLEELAPQHEIVRHILDYRQLSKLKSTYVDALPRLISADTGRLHTTFSQVIAATGRLSSSNPNLQNIPIRTEAGRAIRAAFAAEPGNVLLVADYSQIELRLLAHFSQDPLLLDAYRHGDDIHRLTAAEVFGIPPLAINEEHRRRAKAVNFGIVYGLSAFGLSRQIGIPQSQAAQFIQRYFERYHGVKEFIDRTLKQARADGRVTTLLGRVRPIPDINSRNAAQRGFAERTAVNSPLQGTAADLMKLAMIRIDERLRGSAARMLLQVHDELVIEVPRALLHEVAHRLRHEMEGVYPLSVPLVADVCSGPNWRDLQDVES